MIFRTFVLVFPFLRIATCFFTFTPTVPFSTQVYEWVPVNLMLGVTLRWTGIPSRGSRNTLSHFMLQKPEISSGLLGLLGS